jgi:hypothetical protein
MNSVTYCECVLTNFGKVNSLDSEALGLFHHKRSNHDASKQFDNNPGLLLLFAAIRRANVIS